MSAKKWVFLSSEVEDAENHVGGDWDSVRGLLGGKGANLAQMTRLGVPVPPSFTITTEACNSFLAEGEQFPAGMWEEVLVALKSIEKSTGKIFGDPNDPLLISCRSGAKFSMHDGHRTQHRPQRRDRAGHDHPDRRPTLRL